MNVITYNVELKPTEATFSYWERLLGLYAQRTMTAPRSWRRTRFPCP